MEPTFSSNCLIRCDTADCVTAITEAGGQAVGMKVDVTSTEDLAQMVATAEAVNGGAGVLFIVKNYSGDVMNFEMVADMLEIENATVLTNDDVAVERVKRVAGDVFGEQNVIEPPPIVCMCGITA